MRTNGRLLDTLWWVLVLFSRFVFLLFCSGQFVIRIHECLWIHQMIFTKIVSFFLIFVFFLFRFFYVIKTHFLFKISFSCVVEWKMRSFLFNFKVFKSKSTHKQRAKRNQKLAHSLQSVVIRQFYCASWILKYENVSNGVDKTTKYTRR